MPFVSTYKKTLLLQKMLELGIDEKDIEESFVRSTGRGGQNVNKTATCVYLKHLPTGIEVKCQKERSQSLNRYFARKILVDRIEAMIKGHDSKDVKRIARIRRQKQKRSKRAKEKILSMKDYNCEQAQS